MGTPRPSWYSEVFARLLAGDDLDPAHAADLFRGRWVVDLMLRKESMSFLVSPPRQQGARRLSGWPLAGAAG